MTGLENHIDNLTKRFQQAEERVEEVLPRHRCRQDWHTQAGDRVAVHVETVRLARDDLEIERRADRLGQEEVAIAIYLQMSSEFVGTHVGTLTRVIERGWLSFSAAGMRWSSEI